MLALEDRSAPAETDDAAGEASPVLSTHPKWRPGWLTWSIAVLSVGGIIAGLYPMTAAWITSFNQSQVVTDYESEVREAEPDAGQQIKEARRYNDALSAGVLLNENANVPVGDGDLGDGEFDYDSLLSANGEGLMARIKIPDIDVDLPVFHGTTDAVLTRGAGHLEGSHLPIGGVGTRSVITAHRGLANATMFTDLDKVTVGDRITVETFGKTLVYSVRDIQVIEPEANSVIRAEADEDLLTLITCTPLGINTHRIVVTAERITPTPERYITEAGAAPTIPGFPWWAVWGSAGLVLITAYVLWQGFVDARTAATRSSGRKSDDDISGDDISDAQQDDHTGSDTELTHGSITPQPMLRRHARSSASEEPQKDAQGNEGNDQ